MKKLFTLILAVVMVLALVACGGGNDNATTDENTDIITNTAEATDGTPTTTESTAGGDSDADTTSPDATPDTTTPTTNSVTNTTSVTQQSHAHSYVATVTAPTCANEGYTTHKCACGESYISDKISSVGHSFGQWETTKAATATATGTAQRICDKCNARETKTLGKLLANHTHDYICKVTQAATCTREGIRLYTCSCGDSYTESLPKESHDLKLTTGREPDCLNAGYDIATCSVCGYSVNIEGRPADPTAHAYSKTEKPATCAENGYTKYTCTTCGTSYSETKNALGHDFRVVFCETNTVCDRCGTKGDYVGHYWDAGKPVCYKQCQFCKQVWHELYGHQWGGDIKCKALDCPVYDETCVTLAKNAVNQILAENDSEYEIVKAIHDYIVNNTVYDYENYLNDTIPGTSYGPRGALLYGTAVCDGYAQTFSLLCEYAGIKSERVGGTSWSGEGHAWNQVRIDGIWYNIDVCWDDPVSSRPVLRYDYFLISDSEFYKDHITNSAKHICETSYPR